MFSSSHLERPTCFIRSLSFLNGTTWRQRFIVQAHAQVWRTRIERKSTNLIYFLSNISSDPSRTRSLPFRFHFPLYPFHHMSLSSKTSNNCSHQEKKNFQIDLIFQQDFLRKYFCPSIFSGNFKTSCFTTRRKIGGKNDEPLSSLKTFSFWMLFSTIFCWWVHL